VTLEIALQPLSGSHDRGNFDCGEAALNEWLQRTAAQHQSRSLSRTVVAIPKDLAAWHGAGYDWVKADTILGFFALSSAQVMNSELPASAGKRLPRTVPVARLGRLAVDARLQGQGFGELLLMEAIARTLIAAEQIGVSGMFVDAKGASAAAFYGKYGFEACEADPLRLWIPLTNLAGQSRR
jgi:GNAT superfamily N-acetyltransferase